MSAAPAASIWAIRPLNGAGLQPAPVGPRPELLWIPIVNLVVDRSYQRRPAERSQRLIRRIVEGWDWGKVKALNVRRRDDGRYEVLDGQCTAIAAMTHGRIPELPCLVASPAGLAENAEAFVALNRDRVGVTKLQEFWAAAVGDGRAAVLARAAERAGVRILKAPPARGTGYRPGDTVAVTPLLKHAGDARSADRLLSVLAAARLAPIRSLHVTAAARLLFAPEYSGAVPDARIAEVLAAQHEAIEDAADLERLEKGGSVVHHFTLELFRRAS